MVFGVRVRAALAAAVLVAGGGEEVKVQAAATGQEVRVQLAALLSSLWPFLLHNNGRNHDR